jgi:LmbE family N-acetylglucosaminyl deacetylase
MGSVEEWCVMPPIELRVGERDSLSVLCLGAHSDDIEIGAISTILRIGRTYPNSDITWVVFGADSERATEARRSANHCTSNYSRNQIDIHDFPDGSLGSHAVEIKSCFEALKTSVRPDIIFTHDRGDAHQDHRLISELTWQTFRNHLILEYEIPKYDGDLNAPNVFWPASREDVDAKLRVLAEYFPSQLARSWFTPETFRSLMRLRGIECNSQSGYAEAFYARKIVV